MSQLGTVYATKRRRRNGKSLKPPPKDGVTKSNPSKRHRERLNAELDTLASLLPFEQNILSKLDRLSILRLSVSYLRTKSYFQVVMHKDKEDGLHHDSQFRNRDLTTYDHTLLDGEMFLQALNGFLLMLTCEGEVFFATHSIESYLGFHQSDIVHQSVYELVHSEDREELQRQLMWNSFLPPESANMSLQDVLQPDNSHLLERSFTVRFRCLLDNTSGFLRLDIRGRIKVLHGQNRKTEEPPLALFAICTPFGPPSLLEIPQKEVMFKSKHKLDLALVSMDQRGKMLLGYSDAELANLGGYDLVHYDDLAYVASAHQELLKTGASGMIAYRYQTKEGQWQWLQTSSRLVYKNSKPDFVISTHRPLMEEEGRDLLGKRTMDFKVSYLDAGLTNSYFADSEPLLGAASSPSPASSAPPPQRVNRRYKTQLRDFLSTCRTKRKLAASAAHQAPPPAAAMDYISATDSSTAAAAAVAAAYSNLNTMYTAPYGSGAAQQPDYSLSHSGSFHQGLYSSALDNRFLASTENLFHQYRPLSSYYTEYHATSPYVGNGFLDMSPRTLSYEHQLTGKGSSSDDKLYPCQQLADTSRGFAPASPYPVSPVVQPLTTPDAVLKTPPGRTKHSPPPLDAGAMSSSNSAGSSPGGGLAAAPKVEQPEAAVLMPHHYSPPGDAPRQTVLMWSSGGGGGVNNANGNHQQQSPPPTSVPNGSYQTSSPAAKKYAVDPLKSLAEMNSLQQQQHGGAADGGPSCKWSDVVKTSPPALPPASPKTYLPHHPHPSSLSHPQHQGSVAYSEAGGVGGGGEVWPVHQYHQYYPYTAPYHHHHHHHHHAPHSPVGDNGYPQINRTGVLCCPSLR